MRQATTFPTAEEFERARRWLKNSGHAHEVVSPHPGFRIVGVPALVMDIEARVALTTELSDLLCSGWVDYRQAAIDVPEREPPAYDEDVFGRAAIMVLGACTGDGTKIRIVAHISGDLTEVLPYLNAEVTRASYNVPGPSLTFMEDYRMVTAYPHRIALAKVDEILDAWRVLEELRCRANELWARRAQIEPCYERRELPPAIEIFKRLPQTNCGECGERTCLAFAMRIRSGELNVRLCKPVFDGDYQHLREALQQICRAFGAES